MGSGMVTLLIGSSPHTRGAHSLTSCGAVCARSCLTQYRIPPKPASRKADAYSLVKPGEVCDRHALVQGVTNHARLQRNSGQLGGLPTFPAWLPLPIRRRGGQRDIAPPRQCGRCMPVIPVAWLADNAMALIGRLSRNSLLPFATGK
jgi:hypothetical protein